MSDPRYQKDTTPLTAGSQAASYSSAAPAYAPPTNANQQPPHHQQGPPPTAPSQPTSYYTTVSTPGATVGYPPKLADPHASEEYIERQLKYLGPISKVSDAYRLDTTTLQIGFDDTFPEVSRPGAALDGVRKMNKALYEGTSDFFHVLFSVTLGLLASLFVGVFMGMARFMYTYMAGPFNQFMFVLIASLGPSWRAFFRAGMDPLFESGSLALSNIQVRLGMEAKARHKELKD